MNACWINSADRPLCQDSLAVPRTGAGELNFFKAKGAEVTDVSFGDHVLRPADYASFVGAGTYGKAIMNG